MKVLLLTAHTLSLESLGADKIAAFGQGKRRTENGNFSTLCQQRLVRWCTRDVQLIASVFRKRVVGDIGVVLTYRPDTIFPRTCRHQEFWRCRWQQQSPKEQGMPGTKTHACFAKGMKPKDIVNSMTSCKCQLFVRLSRRAWWQTL